MKNNQTTSIFLSDKTKMTFTGYTIAGIDGSATELKADALSAWRTNVYIGTVFGTPSKAKANSNETFDKNKQGITFNVSTKQRTRQNSTVTYAYQHHSNHQNVTFLAIRGAFTVYATGPYLFNFNDVLLTAGNRHSGTMVRLLVNGIIRAVLAYDRLRISNLPIVLLNLERGDRVRVFVSAQIHVNGTDDDYTQFFWHQFVIGIVPA
ncbi:hypothetical protein OUZ56_029319 [Daphnia magna]|uniref:C1q domain-containing protein n=2 Tax=Daphnia magna TaxID=35525 RepID=A0ABR0B6G1_9CRUS|nr:hypothetical protein OUZ56_029319 [Daphnia magna]